MRSAIFFLVLALIFSAGVVGWVWLWRNHIFPRLFFGRFQGLNLKHVPHDSLEDRVRQLERESDEWKRAVQLIGNRIQAQEHQLVATQRQLAQVHRLAVLQTDVVDAVAREAFPFKLQAKPPEAENLPTWYERLLEEDKNDPPK